MDPVLESLRADFEHLRREQIEITQELNSVRRRLIQHEKSLGGAAVDSATNTNTDLQ